MGYDLDFIYDGQHFLCIQNNDRFEDHEVVVYWIGIDIDTQGRVIRVVHSISCITEQRGIYICPHIFQKDKIMNNINYKDQETNYNPCMALLIGELSKRLSRLQVESGYEKYLKVKQCGKLDNDVDAMIISNDLDLGPCNLINLRIAVQIWSSLPAYGRFKILETFTQHMEYCTPAKERKLKILVFCKVFMHELLPILSGLAN